MDIKDQVLAVMTQAGEPLNADKVAELGGLERKAVDKAMEQLKKEGKDRLPQALLLEPGVIFLSDRAEGKGKPERFMTFLGG